MIGLDGNVIIRTLRRMGLCVQPTEPRFYNLRGCANIRNLEREWKIFYISLDSLISYTALRKNPAAVQHLTECQTLKHGTFRLKYLPLFLFRAHFIRIQVHFFVQLVRFIFKPFLYSRIPNNLALGGGTGLR